MLDVFTPLDAIALATFVVLVGGYGLFMRWSGFEGRSLVGAIQRRRHEWMRNMAVRDNRTIDTILLGALSQGNAFFASTSAIAIGGAAALVGSGEKVQGLLERLPLAARASPVLYEIKLLVIMGVAVYAFFKFAWAFRLTHYAAIMIGATPILKDGNGPDCESHAERTARLVGIAGEHANSGIRSFYHAIAVMAWFYHPLAFIAATVWVFLILLRRDFFSRSRRIVMGE